MGISTAKFAGRLLERRRRGKIIAISRVDAVERHNDAIRASPVGDISPSQKKIIREYGADVFGSAIHADWLIAFAVARGEFLPGWIPPSYYLGVLLPHWQNHGLIGAKSLSRRFIVSDAMPDIAYFARGSWLDRNFAPVDPKSLKKSLFADNDHVYVKTDMGAFGKEVLRVKKDDFEVLALERLGRLVVQKPVVQHAYFDQMGTDNVATVRFTTVKSTGAAAKALASFLRVGRSGFDILVDRQSVEIGIMDDRGTLGEFGLSLNTWKKIRTHPDSGFRFSGMVLPGFKIASKLCETLHDKIPHLTIVGWDLVIDEAEKPQVIELNTQGPGIKSSQVLVGPVFAGLGWEDVWKKPR
ncbi:MAG: sugar-transfer associated ATP-grasp domain-containing protein [Paracoccaceae bacterium]